MKQWLSPAKLNLFLHITSRRADNYHNLQTLFQIIDYCDRLQFDVRYDGQINLLTPFDTIDEQKNLIVIAAKRLQRFAGVSNLGADITIDKKIPMGGGLGGASSNAATVLVALNQLGNLALSTDTLTDIGRQIGADVPIFIHGHSAFAEGIGDQIQSVDIPEYWYVVARPNVEISTPKIFNDPDLTRNTEVKSRDQLLADPFSELKNDCEAIVKQRYPDVANVIEHLSSYGPTRLTGTGSCVFTQCKTHDQALEIQQKIIKLPIHSFVAKGVNSSPLFQK